MDRKVRKYNRNKLIISFLGYFIGTIIFDLSGGEDGALRFVTAIITSGILWFISDFIEYKKHPGLKRKIGIEDKDERTQLIQGKAGVFTFNVSVITMLGVVVFGIAEDNPLISYGAAVIVIFLIAVYWAAVHFWMKIV